MQLRKRVMSLLASAALAVGSLFGTLPASVCAVSTPNAAAAAFTPVAVTGAYYMKNKATGTYAFADGSDADKTNIALGAQKANDAFRMQMTAVKSGTPASGSYIMPKISTTRVVNPFADTPADGTNINLYKKDTSGTQYWVFEAVNTGYVIRNYKNTNLCMTADGKNVKLATYSGADSQIWILEKGYYEKEAVSGSYYLRNNSTKTYAYVNGKDADATPIALGANKGTSAYQMTVTPVKSGAPVFGSYIMPKISTTRVVNPYADKPADGTAVTLYKKNTDGTQYWVFEPVNGGYVIHDYTNPLLVLTADGTAVKVANNAESAAQIWTLEDINPVVTTTVAATTTTAAATTTTAAVTTTTAAATTTTAAATTTTAAATTTTVAVTTTAAAETTVSTETEPPKPNIEIGKPIVPDSAWNGGMYTGYTLEYAPDKDLKTITVYVTAGQNCIMHYGLGIGSTTEPWWMEYANGREFVDFDGTDSNLLHNYYVMPAGVSVPIQFDVSGISLSYNSPTAEYPGIFQFYIHNIGSQVFTVDKITANPPAASEIVRPSEMNWQGHHYQIIDKALSWDEAKAACEKAGGYLAVITSAEENTAVCALMQTAGQSEHYWLGASDAEKEGEWKWVNGEPFHYANWAQDAPDNYTGNDEGSENYLMISNKHESWSDLFEWNDMICKKTDCVMGYICEWDSDVTAIGKCGKSLSWTLTGDGMLKITGTGEMDDCASVTDVPWNAYAKQIKSVQIAEGMTELSRKSFSGCTNLTAVMLPDSLTMIGMQAFADCTALKSVILPENLATLSSAVFKGCTALTEVIFLNKDTKIVDAEALPETAVIRGFKESAAETFAAENERTFQAINTAGVGTSEQNNNSIRWEYYDIGLLKISGSGAMKDFENEADVPWAKHIADIRNVKIEDGVTAIGDLAFYQCVNLESVRLPDTLKRIGVSAFSCCDALPEISLPESLKAIQDSAFYGCKSLKHIDIPNGVYQVGSAAFEGCTLLESVHLPDAVHEITPSLFESCKSLRSIQLPIGVAEIGVKAFHDCAALTAVTVPEHTEKIGRAAFTGCTALRDLYILNASCQIVASDSETEGGTIPAKTVMHGAADSKAAAYASAHDIEFIPFADLKTGDCGTDGDTVKWHITECGTLYIEGTGAMADYTGTAAVPWRSYAGRIRSAVVQDGVTEISRYAFSECTALVDVSIPDSVKLIGVSAFANCTALQSVTIPENTATIGGNAFEGCTALKIAHICGKNTKFVNEETFPSKTAIHAYSDSEAAKYAAEYARLLIPFALRGDANCDGIVDIADAQAVLEIVTKQIAEIPVDVSEQCMENADVNGDGSVDASDSALILGYLENGYFQDEQPPVVTTTTTTATAASNTTTTTTVTTTKAPATTTAAPTATAATTTVTVKTTVLTTTTAEPATTAKTTVTTTTTTAKTTAAPKTTTTAKTTVTTTTVTVKTTVITTTTAAPTTIVSATTTAAPTTTASATTTAAPTTTVSATTTAAPTTTASTTTTAAPTTTASATTTAAPSSETLAAGQCGDALTYTLYADGRLVIAGEGDMTSTPWSDYKAKITAVSLPDALTSLPKAAFSGASALKEIDIPASVKSIGDEAFLGCNLLEKITLHEGLEKIYYHAFYGSLITDIYIPATLTYGDAPFAKCEKLRNVTFGNGITEIAGGPNGRALFTDSFITEITIPETVTIIRAHAFKNCDISEIDIPANVKSIGDEAFAGCNLLEKITLHEGLEKIYYHAFYGSLITDIYIPATLTYGDAPFAKCEKLKTVKFSMDITAIPNGSNFRGLFTGALISELTIPNGVQTIRSYAFKECVNLVRIDLPASVNLIENGAFDGCSGLKDIYIRRVNCKIDDNAATIPAQAIIHGGKDSTAQAYAAKNSRIFTEEDYVLFTPLGDVNCDGSVTQEDLVLLRKAVTGAETLSEQAQKNADVNRDGEINNDDYILLQKVLAGEATLADYILGDVSGDGRISLTDAQLALEYCTNRIAGNNTPLFADADENARALKAMDIDGDGEITIIDVQCILRYYVAGLAGYANPSWAETVQSAQQ